MKLFSSFKIYLGVRRRLEQEGRREKQRKWGSGEEEEQSDKDRVREEK